jgi:HEAT repeat protein
MRHGLAVSGMISLVLFAAGCGAARPTLAGGKPVSHWAGAIRDPNPKVRKEAAAKLGNVGPADPSALTALTAALKDPDAGVRREVIVALMKCGPAAREAVPALEELRQRDRDPQVRAYAGRALEKLKAGQAGASQ